MLRQPPLQNAIRVLSRFVRRALRGTIRHVLTENDPAATPQNDSQPERPPLLARQEELNASTGYQARALMDYVRRIGYVFQANVVQFHALVLRAQDPGFSLPILTSSNPKTHDDLLSEVERLLHNVLMALSTRIDQQRAFLRKHFGEDDALTSEYGEKVKADFGTYAAGMFLRDLRNYLTHYRLPVAESRQTFSTQSYSVTFVLVRSSLLDWQRWTPGAKLWLETEDDQVDIVPVIDRYARIAGAFRAPSPQTPREPAASSVGHGHPGKSVPPQPIRPHWSDRTRCSAG